MDKTYCEVVNNKLTKKPRKKKYTKDSDLFDIPKSTTNIPKEYKNRIKCPKGYKICKCNPKKLKCKKK